MDKLTDMKVFVAVALTAAACVRFCTGISNARGGWV